MKPRSPFPVVTVVLVAANMVAAFALLIQSDTVFRFGLNPVDPSLRTALTSLFLHENLVHLLGNMVFLACVGTAVESAAGSLRFAAVFFVSGLAGAAVFLLFSEPGARPLIGASGAVAGCAAYYASRYYGLRVPIAFGWRAPIVAIVGAWVGLQVLGALVKLGQESGGVSYWTHLGGFAGGLALSLIFGAPVVGALEQTHGVMDAMALRSPAARLQAAKVTLERHPDDPKALAELAEAQRLLGDEGEVETLHRRLSMLTGEAQEPVLERLAELGALPPIPALRRMQLADRFAASNPDLARALLRSVLDEEAQGAMRPDALLALAGLERPYDAAQAERLLQELAEFYPAHPATDLARRRGWLA